MELAVARVPDALAASGALRSLHPTFMVGVFASEVLTQKTPGRQCHGALSVTETVVWSAL